MNLNFFLLILLHEACSTIEQVLFKKSANKLEAHRLRGFKSYVIFFINILKNPLIWGGFFMIGLGWLIWFVVLAGVKLSVAVPVDSLQYVMILVSSYLFLGERIGWMRIMGTLLIIAGVALVALT